MFKTIQIIVMAALCLNFNSRAQSPKTLPPPEKQAILGKAISATTGEALPGAVIKFITPNHTTVSNDKGEFILTLSKGTYNLTLTHIGFKTKKISIQVPLKKQLVITLETDDLLSNTKEELLVHSKTIQPLKIGDTIPEALWNTPLQVVNHPEEKKVITLNDYKGKLIILDFWATHCVPCIRSLYKLDTLQQQLKEKVLILPISYEKKDIIKSFVLKRGWKLSTIIEDTALKTYFPHLIVPHQVWIINGKISAITSGEEATLDHIQKALNSGNIILPHKNDLFFNPTEPITKYLTQTLSELNVHSTLTGYIDGLGGTGFTIADSIRIAYFLNRPLLSIYKEAFKVMYNQIQVEVKNVDDFVNSKYDKRFLYCYQLFMPINKADQELREKIWDDLNSYFGLATRFDKRSLNCFIITRSDDINLPKLINPTPGGSSLLFSQLIGLLNYRPKWTSSMPIFIGEPIKDIMLYNINIAEVESLRDDIGAVTALLKRYGLTIKREVRKVDMLVISKK